MLYKTDPTKSGDSDSKSKVELKKDPLKLQKIKNIYKDASNKKFYKTKLPKKGNSD